MNLLNEILNQELQAESMIEELTANKINLSEIRLRSEEWSQMNPFLDFLKRHIKRNAISNEMTNFIYAEFDQFALKIIAQIYFASFLQGLGLKNSSILIATINVNNKETFDSFQPEMAKMKRIPAEFKNAKTVEITQKAISDFFKIAQIGVKNTNIQYYIDSLNKYLY